MNSEWTRTTWGEVATLEYGKALRDYQNIVEGFPVYGTNRPIGFHDTALCKTPGVVIGRKGAYRGVHYSSRPFFVIDTAFYLKPKAEIDMRWAYYALLTCDINNMDSGSAIPSTSRDEFYKLPVFFPPLAQQLLIAEFLAKFDDRITLLRETNTTLEAIAQAQFKSWFMDFDPVRAKMQGLAPEGMDEATAALFPDSFEESELGAVPKGWSLCPVYDLATFINGATYKAFEPNAERRGLPIIKIAELKSGVSAATAFSSVDMPEKYLIESGDILFSWYGNPDTSIDTFVWPHEAAWLNQHIFRVLPNKYAERAFVLQTFRYLRPVFAELARNKQTTGLGHVTVADLKRLLLVKPDSKALELFNTIVGPVQQRIFENDRKALSLSKLRDTLLPRLISGQVNLLAKTTNKPVEV
jgi:type I restriction enzyme S subunit